MGSSREIITGADAIQVTDNSTIQNIFDSGGTFSIWSYAKSLGASSLGRLMDKSDNIQEGWQSYNRTGNDWVFRKAFSGSFARWDVADYNLNTWNYLTIVYNASNTTNDPLMYINGELKSISEIIAPSGTTVSDSANDLYIGNTSTANRAFDGYLCHGQLWTKELTLNEILESMRKPGSIVENLVGYWPLFGSSDPEPDLSLNNNTGTVLSGAPESFECPSIKSAN